MRLERVAADGVAHRLVAIVERDAQAITAFVVLALVSGEAVADQHVAAGEVTASPQGLLAEEDRVTAGADGLFDLEFAELVAARGDGQAAERGGAVAGGDPGGPGLFGTADVEIVLVWCG